jgi:hypothetical protein
LAEEYGRRNTRRTVMIRINRLESIIAALILLAAIAIENPGALFSNGAAPAAQSEAAVVISAADAAPAVAVVR